MKPEYLNKISKIFIRHNHRNHVRFARNLYYIKTLSEELGHSDYARLTNIIHTFINTSNPIDAQDLFLEGNSASFFSALYLLRLNLSQVRFATTLKRDLERNGKKDTSDYEGLSCMLEHRKTACTLIYTDRLVPVLKLIISYLETRNEDLNKFIDRDGIKLRDGI